MQINQFNTLKTYSFEGKLYHYHSLAVLEKQFSQIGRFPYSIKILLEAVLRQIDNKVITAQDLENMLKYNPKDVTDQEIPFKPARVLMQDFTGVPGIVDLATMRDTINKFGGDPNKINPILPVDLVIDHSVQVDQSDTINALTNNTKKEFDRNQERYEFLRWGSEAFSNLRVIPPATGIVHQVNLEYLASVVCSRKEGDKTFLFPDSLVGTDSHTTMINGLGVLGWGVGGIEAEAVMLGQPIYMLMPEVVGFKLVGKLPSGTTATDLVLTITQKLRQAGVVGKFVEFFGPALKSLSLPDRATIANMAPEYGATMGFFPIDQITVDYLKLTNRPADIVHLAEVYAKEQNLFCTPDSADVDYSKVLELDISSVEPSLAGPKRPQDKILLSEMYSNFQNTLGSFGKQESTKIPINLNNHSMDLHDGSVVIAAITSCTNTSNPSVMIAAGILANKAIQKGLTVSSHVKTSLAPGSRVVTGYLDKLNLTESLNQLGFYTVGYGCTTCIGNSGPIASEISEAVRNNNLLAVSVLSGNRNFEGRIHQDVKANYLASPPLVVAYAIAGTVNIDLLKDPLGMDQDNAPVYLKDIWPSDEEVQSAYKQAMDPALFQQQYASVFSGNKEWNQIQIQSQDLYQWKQISTYIRKPSFFDEMELDVPAIKSIQDMRVLVILGDSVTTDHISPAGAIQANSPAGKWLQEQGIDPQDFNTYGSRRGNHEVMMRGTFANIRLRNNMLDNVEGGYTCYIPENKQMSIYDAAMAYKDNKTPLIVIAGKEYGTGSSRDWAAKGTFLLGVKVVIAQSFERIHRSNLVGMGILPLQFKETNCIEKYDITGKEFFSLPNLNTNIAPKCEITLHMRREDGSVVQIPSILRIESSVEIEYYKNGGILNTVLRNLAA